MSCVQASDGPPSRQLHGLVLHRDKQHRQDTPANRQINVFSYHMDGMASVQPLVLVHSKRLEDFNQHSSCGNHTPKDVRRQNDQGKNDNTILEFDLAEIAIIQRSV